MRVIPESRRLVNPTGSRSSALHPHSRPLGSHHRLLLVSLPVELRLLPIHDLLSFYAGTHILVVRVNRPGRTIEHAQVRTQRRSRTEIQIPGPLRKGRLRSAEADDSGQQRRGKKNRSCLNSNQHFNLRFPATLAINIRSDYHRPSSRSPSTASASKRSGA